MVRLCLLVRWLAAALVLGVLVVTPARSASGGPSPAAQDIEQAKKHMSVGVAFMQDPGGPKYEEAYPEFKKAYELSGSLNALQNLAICAQNLELDGEAIELYQEFLEGKGEAIDPEIARQVQRDKQALEAVVAWVTLSTDKPGATIQDVRYPRRGTPITNIYRGSIDGVKLGIHPGRHEFTASLAGYPDQVWEVAIKNGGVYSRQFTFAPNPSVAADGGRGAVEEGRRSDRGEREDDEGLPVYPFVAAGATVAVAVPMVVFMAMSSAKKSEYDDARHTAPREEQEELKSDLETTSLVADVLLGVTLAGAVTTIILFATADYGGDEEDGEGESTDTAGWPRFGVDYALAPALDPRTGAGVVVTGRF